MRESRPGLAAADRLLYIFFFVGSRNCWRLALECHGSRPLSRSRWRFLGPAFPERALQGRLVPPSPAELTLSRIVCHVQPWARPLHDRARRLPPLPRGSAAAPPISPDDS